MLVEDEFRVQSNVFGGGFCKNKLEVTPRA